MFRRLLAVATRHRADHAPANRNSVYHRRIQFAPLEDRRMLSVGMSMLKDINIVPIPSDVGPESIVAMGDIVYFAADVQGFGRQLWKSDGTEAGTVMVKDIYSGTYSFWPAYLKAVGQTLYFLANAGVHGYELWKSDGTESGTTMVTDIRARANGASAGFDVRHGYIAEITFTKAGVNGGYTVTAQSGQSNVGGAMEIQTVAGSSPGQVCFRGGPCREFVHPCLCADQTWGAKATTMAAPSHRNRSQATVPLACSGENSPCRRSVNGYVHTL